MASLFAASLSVVATFCFGLEIERQKFGVVKVMVLDEEGMRKTGAGFVVSAETNLLYIMTAHHVVEGARNITVTFFSQPGSFKAKFIVAEPDLDIALLTVGGEDKLPQRLETLELGDPRDLKGGDDVWLLGFPQGGGDWTPTKGHFANRTGQALLFQGIAAEGNSGGPIIYDGAVVGMVTSARGQFTRAASTITLGSWYLLEYHL